MTANIESEYCPQTIVLHLEGRLTTASIPKLEEDIFQALGHQPAAIELNMSELQFIDSTTLGFFHRINREVLAKGVTLRFIDPVPAVEKIFRMANLQKILHIQHRQQEPEVYEAMQQTALLESFEMTQRVLTAMGDGLLGVDMDGQILYVTPQTCELFQLEEHQLHEMTLDQLIAPPTDPKQWRGSPLLGRPSMREWVHLRRGAMGKFEALMIGIRVESGDRPIGVLIGINDRSELEAARRELIITQQQMSIIASNIKDLLLMLDLEGKISFVNKAVVNAIGHDEVTLEDMHWRDIAAPGQLEIWEQLWQVVYSGRAVENRELQIIDAKGNKRWGLVSLQPIKDETGFQTNVLLSIRDIQHMHQQKQQLQALDRMDSISRLSTGLARDLDKIIRHERKMLQEIREQVLPGHSALPVLVELQLQNEYMRNLVHQLLICGERVAAVPQKVEVDAVVDRALRMIEEMAGERITINVNLDAEQTAVMFHEEDLFQILTQVMLNAVESIAERGEIHITSQRVKLGLERQPYLTPRPAGRFLRLSIRDNGYGMIPEILNRALEPFFTTKDSALHAGMGLAYVYGLLRQHHGWIELISEPNEFTSVELYLPLDAVVTTDDVGRPEPEPEPEDEFEESVSVSKILVVDDEALILNFVSTYMQRKGYRMLRASTPQEAISVFKENAAELEIVIMDLNLPGMSGMELIDKLAAIKPAIKVVISSGMGTDALMNARTHANVKAVLQKPYRGEQLANVVRQLT